MQLPKKYKRLIIAVSLLLLILIFPPIYLYEFYPYITSIPIGITLGYMIPTGIRRMLYSINEDEEETLPRESDFFIVIVILSVIGTGLLFSFWCRYRIDSAFRNTGILVKDAIVTDGKSITGGRKPKYYDLQLSYKLKSGTKYHAVVPVKSDVFNNVYKDQTVDILYLPSHVDMVRVLIGENVSKYLKRPNRDIKPTDIDSIFKYNDTELLKFLDRTSYRWQAETSEGSTLYSNHLTLESVVKLPNMVVYGYGGYLNGELYLAPLKIEGKSKSGDDNSTIYFTKKYKIVKKSIINQLDTKEDDITTIFTYEKRVE
ncbi:OapA N-terminal domain-containing protein [Emticicia sp. 21SJ11W-3]|uniref:OapA N-terminal domain-containing protein n=1 Tax=Emticicia sp. 21SJ11W-3 TaxID=2916755 RepID=UPI00209FDBE6|nr:OapA N-terminal domain-containing protein [Emticicia sp. 21SJ11W-3]UTA69076.1 hypothetical protein MB380_04560 [Emticicia sp. 21SJ11W-3]